jgi:hypothetical protein
MIERHAGRGVGVTFHGRVENIRETGGGRTPLRARRELPSAQLAQRVASRRGAGCDLAIELPSPEMGAKAHVELGGVGARDQGSISSLQAASGDVHSFAALLCAHRIAVLSAAAAIVMSVGPILRCVAAGTAGSIRSRSVSAD